MSSKQHIRAMMRTRRQRLSLSEQQHAASCVMAIVKEQDDFQRAETVALYIAYDGELNPEPLVSLCFALGKRVYLPVVDDKSQLSFVHYEAHQPLLPNRYGIPEPIKTETNQASPAALDLVFVPLVSFDRQGNRLGMGAGYYDKCFSFKNQPDSDKPILIGLAHSFQESAAIETDRWDVRLDHIITESQIFSKKV